ncbi:MAG: hypothetical protein DMD37_07305 [Gemmatimonadetes bacterium]|nr:MAG: hypothetical protein DMD74_02185 [Gemmatimonadota bacterium]PYO65624.1 MAG: hypothetical protein DMD71_10250 [Gemmatimonadota bacterium]PYO84112.1 MAG: hypothetical protein DMD68_07895 [Gemmatimonadota bacterium]PYP63155.1 MAG: hypothetical protein DMD37_07305 [Gemmatimonadota bacterium]
MNAELQGYLTEIEKVKADARALVAGLSEEQANRRPAPDKWCIAECLAHLNVADAKTLPAFDRAIRAGRTKGRTAAGPFRYGWFSRWMIASMEPPPKRRMRTFKIFVPPPPGAQPLATLLPEFLKVRDELAERVRQADGLDLGSNRVVSPVTPLLRMPLGAYFAFVMAHERRHLWQAWRVREGLH